MATQIAPSELEAMPADDLALLVDLLKARS